MTRLTIALAAGALLCIAPDAGAQKRKYFDCDLHLVSAKGVPNGAAHAYDIRGLCRETDDEARVLREGWVQSEAVYDVKSATYSESIRVTGYGAPATTKITAKCGDDPMITKAKCASQFVKPMNPWPDFVAFWNEGQHLTRENVTYAKAVDLSKNATVAKNPPPPPPPPKGKPKVAIKDAAQAVKRAMAEDSAPPIRTNPIAPPTGRTEIPLAEGTKIELASGQSLQALTLDGELHWMIVGAEGEVLRTYPAGSKAFKTAAGEILVDWGGGVNNLGKVKAQRLRLPRR